MSSLGREVAAVSVGGGEPFPASGRHAPARAAQRLSLLELGIGSETLRHWIKQAEVDRGLRSSMTTADRQRIVELEKENRELHRANETLKSLFCVDWQKMQGALTGLGVGTCTGVGGARMMAL